MTTNGQTSGTRGKSCQGYQAADKLAKPVVALLQPVAFLEKPWQKLGMNSVGPLSLTEASPKFVISLVDYHSKWLEACLPTPVTSQVVMEFLRALLSREGYLEELVTDNRPQFKSQMLEDFLKERGIKHCISSVCYTQANGLVEQFNQSLKDFIQLCLLEGRVLKTAITSLFGSVQVDSTCNHRSNPS